MGQDKISKLPDDKKNVWDEATTGPKNVKLAYKPGYGERWNKIRPTKFIFFWSLLATIILTLIVSFNWGGLVTGTTAQKMADDVVTQRLSLICAGQFNQDPQKDQKLTELKDTSSYQRDDYVKTQGWTTMPGETAPDNKVADEYVKLIVQSG